MNETWCEAPMEGSDFQCFDFHKNCITLFNKHLLEIVIKDNITSLLSVNDSEKIKTTN
jgi:hypothetical protein